MTIKNLNIEEYLLGHCDAQQMHELASWASGSGKRLRLLFALRCAFLDLKYQHHFDDANLIAAPNNAFSMPFRKADVALYAENYLQTQKLINL